ncbi:hypothetical protein [Enterobacter sp. RIT418]|uniref:hypothetical protein n=1 Tax=Enterobacter sp. RIT418 TaxID=2202164 RepID=UPI000DCE2E18|nr:hypothetical protein [Enterobacter sp. RIT 418]RAU38731.1 hypothetical protein DBY73_000210 [Enterobacter sp. RIT 418]
MNSPGFPVCKPGGDYQRSGAERELTCGKKSGLKRKRLPFSAFLMRFMAFIVRINHLAENARDVTLLKIVINVR